jgi:hypothetical protein
MAMTIVSGTGNRLITAMMAYSFVGGFVGVFKDGVDIIDCHNTGAVSVNSTVTSGSQVFCGGITGGGQYSFSTAYHGSIQDCSSTGDITAKALGSWTITGGIAGTIVGGDVGDLANTTRIVRCRASGTVSIAGTSSGFPYIGGIVGYNYYGALVSQSYFTGAVIADKANDYVGGIAGYNSQTGAPKNSRIEDCWSSGTVRGFNNAGGIVGQNQVNTYIKRCYSIAAIETTSTAAGTGTGGISGLNASAQTDAITGCLALNSSIITANTSNKIHRITGTNGSAAALSNNLAYSGLTLSGGAYAADKGADKVDGEDCAAQPVQSVYEGLGWDFSNVWKMSSNGYPVLKWQI